MTDSVHMIKMMFVLNWFSKDDPPHKTTEEHAHTHTFKQQVT